MPNQCLNSIKEDIEQIALCDLPWEDFSGRSVLVTGANGFLGTYLIRTLCSLYRLGKTTNSVNVIAMVRDLERAKESFNDLLDSGALKLIQRDLTIIGKLNLGPIQYIIHAASHASPRFYGVDPVGTLLPNTVGTATLLDAMYEGGDPRGFLFISSSEVYGGVSQETPLEESQYGVIDPVTLRACYAESKRMGETMCVAWHRQFGIPTFIARPFHTYGPGLTPADGRVFSDFVFNVVRNENIVMNSDGMARRAFCYVTDTVAGLFSILLKGSPACPYNVANPEGELSILELANLLVTLFPEKKLSVERRLKVDNQNYMPSTYNRLIPNVHSLEMLDWRAKIMPEAGFKRTIEAYML